MNWGWRLSRKRHRRWTKVISRSSNWSKGKSCSGRNGVCWDFWGRS